MLRAMRVRTTIFLLLLLAATAFVAGLFQVRRMETEKTALVTMASERRWKGEANDFWKNQAAPVQKMVESLSGRDDVMAAVLNNDTRWAKTNWDDRTLASFLAEAVWVYHRDGTLFYAHATTQTAVLEKSPLASYAVVKLFESGRSLPFYFNLPPDKAGHPRVVEVRGARIQPSWDYARQEPAEGFFLAGRIWDDETLQGALTPGIGEAHLLPAGHAAAAHVTHGRMAYSIPLRDALGQDIDELDFSNEDKQLEELDARYARTFWSILAGALALFIVLFLLLDRAVVSPLRRVIRGLDSGDLSALEPLRGQKAEFGQLAWLIDQVFEQRARLIQEMDERAAAQKALLRSEEMLRHSQKMEAVGRLAGGVAHDFNNLLTAIIGYADLLRQRFADNPSARQPAELIHQAGEQAAGLTRQLLAFSRKQLLQPKVIDLNVLLTNLQRLLQRIIGEHIEIVAHLDFKPAYVKADAGQIEQVVVNLGVNARDAMPRGGRLEIRTRHVGLEDTRPVADLAPGRYVALEVSDTGEGMDAETRTRVFEPFFTTKGPGKGTGLGLATVYGIIKQSRGGIVVESEPGRGSTFRIFLPEENGPAETSDNVVAPVRDSARQETILVVEDEAMVRDLVSEILRGHGYEVLVTDRGSEAFSLAREASGGIDLLISDVVMPEMNGAVVAQRVHEICPRARVLFVSGYSEHDIADQGMETLAYQVLQKPFSPDALARKVREVLDGG
jgi:signal transduction histidine kinase/CheY-like chemotaxis protein